MNSFHQILTRLHRRRRLGRLLVLILVLASLFGVTMLALGFSDYHLALSSSFRVAAITILWITLALLALVMAIRIIRTPLTTTAGLADQALGDDRRSSLSATYLSQKKAETEMEQFHLDRSLTEAGQHLSKVPFLSRIPAKAIAIGGAISLAVTAAIFAVKALAPEPFFVVSARLLSPGSDLPPYSPLRFKVTPHDPSAVYQGEATVQVEITGGEVDEDVICLIRDPATGVIEEATTFREKPGRYARKFENALTPLEFAFATGRARSDWHKLDVLFQPRISGASILITPPAYTGQPASSYPLEAGEIKALEGSTINLRIQSNRPLIGGALTLEGMDQEDNNPVSQVEAEVSGNNEASFTWTAHRSAKISALIQDIRYTPAEKPLEFSLKTIPDQAPLATISEPQPMVLATPRTTIPLNGDIEDDYGLATVSLTRTLVGFRDRDSPLAEGLSEKDYNFDSPLKLAELGVEPGQTLEFYLEAADRNPSLLGVGVSDVVRVQIISEEDYAQRIRDQFQLEDFTARYRALADAIQKSREALDELKKAETDEEREAARKKAEEAHAQSQDLAEKIADDFKAFDLEGRLQESAKAAAQALQQNKEGLQKLPSDPAERDAAIQEMQERLGGAAEQAKQIQQDAELVKKIGDVLEMAAKYRKLINDQKSIIQRLQEVAKMVAEGNTSSTNRLPGLAKVQERNRDALNKFAEELEKRTATLPEEAAEMKADVAEFLEKLAALNIPDPMDAASEAANNGKSGEALRRARLALQLMERLIEDPDNGFCQACQGQSSPRFRVKQDMASTMQQMLDSLMARAGSGEGTGGDGGVGGGAGGGGQDGYSVAGNDAAIPAYGPNRLSFSASEPTSANGSSRKPGGGASGNGPDPLPSEVVSPETFRENVNQAIVPDQVPAKYRDAVKRYFSSSAESPQPQPEQ